MLCVKVNGQNMLGVSHHHAVKVLCEAQTDLVFVVLRQRADGNTSPMVNILCSVQYDAMLRYLTLAQKLMVTSLTCVVKILNTRLAVSFLGQPG